MIKKEHINGEICIAPCDLYEWTLDELNKGSFNETAEEKVLNNLKSVEWIKDKFVNLNGLDLVRMYISVLADIKDGTMPPDPMSLSAFYYNFTQKGLDTYGMRNAINSSKFIMRKIANLIK